MFICFYLFNYFERFFNRRPAFRLRTWRVRYATACESKWLSPAAPNVAICELLHFSRPLLLFCQFEEHPCVEF